MSHEGPGPGTYTDMFQIPGGVKGNDIVILRTSRNMTANDVKLFNEFIHEGNPEWNGCFLKLEPDESLEVMKEETARKVLDVLLKVFCERKDSQ